MDSRIWNALEILSNAVRQSNCSWYKKNEEGHVIQNGGWKNYWYQSNNYRDYISQDKNCCMAPACIFWAQELNRISAPAHCSCAYYYTKYSIYVSKAKQDSLYAFVY